MRLLPDFEHTATGYIFLDRLTAPYWRWRAKVATRRLEESVGRHLVHSPPSHHSPSPTRKDD